MRITLITPAKEGEKVLNRSYFVPLSLMYLAAYTPDDVEVRIIDENLEKIDFEDKPDLVGITSMTATAMRAYEIADTYRSRGVKVVMGGIHASMLPQEALEHADTVVIGEAENIWPAVVEDADRGCLDPVYRMEDYDDFTDPLLPRRDLVNREHYWNANCIQTSRGCPHNCSFCSVTAFNGRHVRERKLDNLLAEIEEIPRNPVLRKRIVPFVDDNIAAHPRRAKELFKALIPLKTLWGSQACINVGEDEELVALAAESGCRLLFIGLETVSARSLQEMGKKQNKVEHYSRSLKTLRKHGIHVLGAFMFGFDSDHESIFADTLDFALRNKLQMAQFSNLTPLPGTRLYEQMVAEGRVMEEYWLDKDRGNRTVFQPKNFSAERLCEKTHEVQRRFYSMRSIAKRFYFSRSLPNWLVFNLVYHRLSTTRSQLFKASDMVPGAV
ncbi:MAG: radical SAM protein [Actinomycetota bacterium]|nr:radical SAM protein [Actinomycetota bacterium]